MRYAMAIDLERCIGCRMCASACPYGVRYLNETEKVVEKCTLCEQRINQGELPQCVAQCGGMARFFGDLEAGIETFEGPEQADGKRVVLGEFCNPFTDDQMAYVKRAIDILHAHGVSVGVSTGSNSPEMLKKFNEMGINFISAGADFNYLYDCSRQTLATLRKVQK